MPLMNGNGKLPWFPFWVDDFSNSRHVKLMSDGAVGIYTLMLCEEWRSGPLPADAEAIASLIGRPISAAIWREVRECFVETASGLVNMRLEAERAEQQTKHARRVNAGRRGAASRWDTVS